MVAGKGKTTYPERTVVMDTATAIPASRLIEAEELEDLFQALVARGYQVIGPTVHDHAIVLRELSSTAELPFGWGVRLEPGGYQLRHRDDTAAFGHAAGPQSWKRFPHPPPDRLWSATRTADGYDLDRADDEEQPRYAFLGVRPCDLRAIAIQDRVLAQPGSRYAARRARLFIVAVNCKRRAWGRSPRPAASARCPPRSTPRPRPCLGGKWSHLNPAGALDRMNKSLTLARSVRSVTFDPTGGTSGPSVCGARRAAPGTWRHTFRRGWRNRHITPRDVRARAHVSSRSSPSS
jgi:hypothetical protein